MKWISRERLEGSIACRRRTGRPRHTTPQEDTEIVNFVKGGPFTNAVAASHEFNLTARVIRKRWHEAGIHHYIPAVRPPLTREHKDARIAFAESHYGYDWEKVIFPDEKTFSSDPDKKHHLWRKPNTRYEPENIQRVKLSGRITCGVWGWISINGPGALTNIEGNLNRFQYIDILEDVYLPTVRYTLDNWEQYTFMQDNSSVHTSADVRRWFQDHPDVQIIQDWPPLSPDWNPIENVWGLMETRWTSERPRNRENLFQLAHEKWDNLQNEPDFQNLYRSIPKRLRMVLDNDGDRIGRW